MSCLPSERLAALVDAELGEEGPRASSGAISGVSTAASTAAPWAAATTLRSNERAHLDSCARCGAERDALRALAAELARDPVREPIDLLPLVLRRASLPTRRRRTSALYAAAACAAFGIFGVSAFAYRSVNHVTDAGSSSVAEAGFQSRGGKEGPDTWVAIHLYRVGSDGTSAISAGGALEAGDGLLLSYDNGGPRPYRYLMAYAVDARGEVHWDQPASIDGNAASIAIEPGVGHELPDEVRFRLPPGPLRVVGLFSDGPISVSEVERALRGGGRYLPPAGVGTHELWLRVDGGVHGSR